MPVSKSINDADALLVFSVGPVLCCSPALTVVTVMLPPSLHKPPGSDRSHPGVFHHAMGMVSVIDLRQRFGVEETDWRVPGRMVVTEIPGGLAGFMVDEILDVRQWPEQGWGKLPALVPREVFKRTLLLKNQIHLYADFEDLYNFRESGYLRSHIASLVEKVKKEAAQQSINEKHEIHEVNVHGLDEPQLKASVPEIPINYPDKKEQINSERDIKSNPPSQYKPLGSSLRKEDVISKTDPASLRRQSESKTSQAINKPVFSREPPKITLPAIEQDQDSSEVVDSRSGMVIRSESSSGVLVVLVLIAIILATGALVMTSFNKTTSSVIDRNQKIVKNNVITPEKRVPKSSRNYQASVTQDAEGIVITIDEEPDELAEEKSLTVQLDTNKPDSEAPVLPALAPAEKIIVHIVVKGDTLWDIANKYVRNPWRYPELAKLSKIKNPHRIYPGNKVKIVMRATGKTAH